MLLIFKNCEKYNIPKRNDHIVLLARYCAKNFRKLYTSKMKTEHGSGVVIESKDAKSVTSIDKLNKKRTISSSSDNRVKKKSKKLNSDETSIGGNSRGSMSVSSRKKVDTDEMSISSVRKKKRKGISSSASVSSRTSQKIKLDTKNISRSVGKNKFLSPKPASVANTPLSLHEAIAQVKELFPIRRQYKDLVSWEGACSRFYREFMRHPWLGAARPKFIFHAPVTLLFPEVKEAYNSKIENPTDLTAVECKLLQGGVYNNSKAFIDQVALVFVHAITFNQTGVSAYSYCFACTFNISTISFNYFQKNEGNP